MKLLLSLFLAALLTACGQGSSDAGTAFIGRWIQKNHPESELDITHREDGSFTITRTRKMDSAGKHVSTKSYDANLVDGKLVSQGFTTFLRADGVLVFQEREYHRGQ